MPYRTKVSPELAIPEGESPAARTGAVECAGHAARSTQARCAARRRRQGSDSTLTLEDAVIFFDVVLGTGLDAQERGDLVAFLRAL